MKRTARIVLAVALVLVVAAVADAAVIKVKVQLANIRNQPDATAPVITQAALGTMFDASRKVGSWWEITVSDATGKAVTGYINADIVEEVGAGNPPAAAPQQPAYQPQPTPSYQAPRPYGGSNGGFLIMGGPVLSNLALSEPIGSDVTQGFRFGFAGGVGYEIPFGPTFGLQIGAFYSTGGCKFTSGSDAINYVANALAVPLRFKLSFSGPYISAGPYAGLIMSPKITYNVGGTTGETTISTSNINTFVYGLLLGGGFEFDLGGMKAFIEASYNLGLSNISKSTSSTVKPTSINFIFGLKL